MGITVLNTFCARCQNSTKVFACQVVGNLVVMQFRSASVLKSLVLLRVFMLKVFNRFAYFQRPGCDGFYFILKHVNCITFGQRVVMLQHLLERSHFVELHSTLMLQI